MKILLDECVDRRLTRDLIDHDAETVASAGWAGLRNGELLKRAELQFDVFITTDRNLEHQQNVRSLSLSVVILLCRSNRLADLRLLIPEILAKLPMCRPGTVTHIGSD